MSWTQKFVYQKWPDKSFPIVNHLDFVFSNFGLEGGGGGLPLLLLWCAAILIFPCPPGSPERRGVAWLYNPCSIRSPKQRRVMCLHKVFSQGRNIQHCIHLKPLLALPQQSPIPTHSC